MEGLNEETQEVMEELNTDLAVIEDRPQTEKKDLWETYTLTVYKLSKQLSEQTDNPAASTLKMGRNWEKPDVPLFFQPFFIKVWLHPIE